MIGVGIIGFGYWGPNLVRNFFQTKGAQVRVVCDARPGRLETAAAGYPSVRVTTDPMDCINDPAVDAVAVATPVSSHYDLALAALRAGKHVLVEKPMTAGVEQGGRLVDEAARRGLTLMVDHTFIYMGAVRKIKEIMAQESFGDVYYYDSTRVNLGLFQHDVNVIWDLAVHDLSIMDFLLPQKPVAVSATGMAHVPGRPENVAWLTFYFQENVVAHVNVNWLSPVKLRQTLIGGNKKMIVFDDLHSSEKVRVYDRGITLTEDPESMYKVMVGYRTGDMWAPAYEQTEALRLEAAHFVDCLEHGTSPITGGEMGLRVVAALEAADASLKKRGQLVELPR